MAQERERVTPNGRNRGPELWPPKWRAESVQAGMDAMQRFLDSTNGGSERDIAVGAVAVLTHEHRYLQNETVLALLRIIQTYGELSPEEMYVDGRNEAMYRVCQKLAAVLRETYGSLLNVESLLSEYSYDAYCEELQAEEALAEEKGVDADDD